MYEKQQRRPSLADMFPGMIRTTGSSVSINGDSNDGGSDGGGRISGMSRSKTSGGFGQSSSSGASATVMSDKLKQSLANDLFRSSSSSSKKSSGSGSKKGSAGGLRGSNHTKKSILRGSGAKSTNDLFNRPSSSSSSSTSSPPLSPSASRKVALPSALKKGGLKKSSSGSSSNPRSPERLPSDSSDKTATTAASSTVSSKKAWEDEDDEEYSLDVPLRDAFGGGDGTDAEDNLPSRSAPKRTSSIKKEGAPRRKVPQRSVSADQLTGMNVQVRLPNSSKPLRKTRSISFSKSVQVRKIPSQTELLEREVQDERDARNALFFQAEEYDAIKRKTGALVRAIQQGRTPGGVTYCTRGLEKYFKMEEVQMKRVAAWDSVLYEQDNQRLQRKYDDTRLADSYSQWTHSSEEDAAERARLDEQAIENYTRKTRLDIKRTVSAPTLPNRR